MLGKNSTYVGHLPVKDLPFFFVVSRLRSKYLAQHIRFKDSNVNSSIG